MLLCADGSLYTGSATDVERRFEAHRSGCGAKYTRSHPPLAVVYREACGDKGAALRYFQKKMEPSLESFVAARLRETTS